MDATKISTREAEVLAAVGEHLSNAQIAGRLRISVRTVESHVAALLRKLDAADRHALAARAEQARTGRFLGLPAGRTTFVGRAADVAAVEAALDTSRLVTVVGPAGWARPGWWPPSPSRRRPGSPPAAPSSTSSRSGPWPGLGRSGRRSPMRWT
ncbi:response regulator transcription factor [Actinomadura madurae]|uniref:response regulator transcription factor n=1 Tax=Actinomadura madurae TaxID=1993 RepID=UPI0020D204C9|nr:LuxR C-terminal-related transcriptional regulator [Actinomadura madurae]MCQ0007976.1 LuxR C-terminal-related transcriptional regulator [Actinomadura madurae]MCQ0016709.1 LuxR C-terminal-related transcriptional regulator [Actinomadura madurae]